MFSSVPPLSAFGLIGANSLTNLQDLNNISETVAAFENKRDNEHESEMFYFIWFYVSIILKLMFERTLIF